MKPKIGSYYQHRYGGIYRVDVDRVLSTVDRSVLVVYTHIYPFENEVWARPLSEWEDGRFREIDEVELKSFLNKDEREFQQEICEAKASSKR